MKLYLNNTPLDEAIEITREVCSKIVLESEIVDTVDALSRITYKAHYAKISSPHFTAAAMDGIATRFEYTLNADTNNPVTLREDMFEVVDTGDPINEPFDCVIMKEDLVEDSDGYVVRKSHVPYQNVRPIGEDIQFGEMIVPKKRKITPLDISSLLASKITKVEVYKNLKVGIIPTGDEIIDSSRDNIPSKGELLDFNSWTFKALVESYGVQGIRYDVVKDNKDDLKAAVMKATEECDMVILNAGSSKGRGDYAGSIIEDCGEKFFHGISIKPGKPASLGIINDTPIFGVPGYPVSAFFVIESLVKEGINSALNNITNIIKKNPKIDAYLSRKVVSSLKNDEYIRVKLGKVDEKVIAIPVGKGAGTTMSLTNADGYFIIPKDVEGLKASSKVNINLLREDFNPDNTLVSIGSHDIAMDIIADYFKDYGLNFSSTHTGSMGGIMALKRGETHIAPSHLLGENGVYNIEYCEKYLGKCVIIKFLKRIQGFIVEKGNPLNIRDFKDLERVNFVNRQKGSGTRMLLDYNIEKFDVNKSRIKGYDREEITHLSVAAQIKGGSADCGLGVLAAANMMGLDFIPVCSEDYDIILNREMLEDCRIKTFLEIITSKDFKERLNKIGGYDLTNAGEVVVLGG
ncbi:molybdopterin biosynthesis protein [Clostridium cylindrosporum]|uniref:Molybdopterin molybdenumtransferase n=1 Tax=Clostridium cylindrosporum DSM 605 TaxID=1121307 RepID=A0A0J8DEP6_CLOCY|nr:molybdopterin biosynthesis protein [Clostridium cylindrosporum]KMT22699.1 molybdenum cofactor synthesis domain [Clostridium cylindrosporum DSM 605]